MAANFYMISFCFYFLVSHVDVVTNGNDYVRNGSALSENPDEFGVESAPAGHLAAVTEEAISLPSVDEVPPLEVKSSVEVLQAEESPSELATQTKKQELEEPHGEAQLSDNGVAENQSEPSSAGHLDTVSEPEHIQQFVDNAAAENLSDSLSFEKVSHSEPVAPEEDPLKAEVEAHEPGDIVVTAAVFKAETDEVSPSNPKAVAVESEEAPDSDTVTMPTVSVATEHEDSHAPSALRAGTDDISDIKISSNVSVGDPKVTTEMDEHEETLEDGTIVKSKVVRTKQEYLVTEGFDSINDEQVKKVYYYLNFINVILFCVKKCTNACKVSWLIIDFVISSLIIEFQKLKLRLSYDTLLCISSNIPIYTLEYFRMYFSNIVYLIGRGHGMFTQIDRGLICSVIMLFTEFTPGFI